MRRIIFSLLFVCCLSNFAKGAELPVDAIAEVQVSQMFDEQFLPDIKNLIDFVEWEEKVSACVKEYIKKQSKSYSKIVQNNLYDLMRNFDRIASKIYGKKQSVDQIPYEDKIEVLGRVQCEAYYKMGILK